MKRFPTYKVFCKNLEDIKTRFSIGVTEIKEVPGTYNMLFLKDYQVAVVCEDDKFYIISFKY